MEEVLKNYSTPDAGPRRIAHASAKIFQKSLG